MDSLIVALQRFGAPFVGFLFFLMWGVTAFPTFSGFGEAVPSVLAALFLASLIGVSARYPVRSLVGVGVLLLLQFFFPVLLTSGRDVSTYIGFGLALFFAGLSASSRIRVMGLVGALIFIAIGSALFYTRLLASRPWRDLSNLWENLGEWLGYGIQFAPVMLGLWLAGFLVRNWSDRKILLLQRAEATRSLQSTEVELSVEQERGRISQELHDVLAHSLAVIAMQADGARYANQQLPDSVGESLDEIARAARHALIDAQLVIEGVSDDGEDRPQPGIADVGVLVETVRSAGGDIIFTHDGVHGPLSKTQELAIFRIIQESLTNSVKHAPGASITVGLDWDGPGVSIRVATAHTTTSAGSLGVAGRVGRGIAGMKQRARTADGWLTAGPDGDGFRVTAFIPYRESDDARSGASATTEIGG